MATQSYTLGAVVKTTDNERLQWDNTVIPDTQFIDELVDFPGNTRYPVSINVYANTAYRIELNTGSTPTYTAPFKRDLSSTFEQNWELDFSYEGTTWTFTHDDFNSDTSDPYLWSTSDTSARSDLDSLYAALDNGDSGVVVTLRDGPRAALPAPTAPTSVVITAVPNGNEGTTATLAATVTGGTYDTGPTYAWTVSGGTLSDATAATPVWTRPAVTSDTAYTIDLEVTVAGDGTAYENGTSVSASATQISTTVLDVPTPLPLPTAPSVTITAIPNGNEGTQATLAATVTGGGYDAISYDWDVSGGTLSDDTLAVPVWTRPSVASDTSHTVDLTVTVSGNGNSYRNGESTTASATQVSTTVLNAAPLPLPTAPSVMIAAVSDGDEGTTVQLSATVTGGAYDTGPTYAWTVSGGTLNNATSETPTWTRPSVNANTDYDINLAVSVAGDGTSYRAGESASASATTVSSTVRNVVTDTTPPAFSSANVNEAGTTFTIEFDEALDTGSIPALSAFAIRETLTDNTVRNKGGSGITVVGSEVRISFTVAILAGSTLTVAYTAPGTNPLQDAAGNDVVTFAAQSATNNVPVPTATLTVDIGNIPSGNEGTTVQLSPTVGGTATGTITYAWSATGGTLDDATIAAPTWTRPSVSSSTTYTVSLTVMREGVSASDSDTTTVFDTDTQLPLPVAPSATIDAVATGSEGTTVPLSATVTGGSYDSLSYAWSVEAGTLNNAAAESPIWTRPQVNANTSYDIDLTVRAHGDGSTRRAGTTATATATTISATVTNVAAVAYPATLPFVAAEKEFGRRRTVERRRGGGHAYLDRYDRAALVLRLEHEPNQEDIATLVSFYDDNRHSRVWVAVDAETFVGVMSGPPVEVVRHGFARVALDIVGEYQ